MALHNDVFKQQIWEYFCGDLESCLNVSKLKQTKLNSEFKGGLNFTATLVIFSVIELCAGWWKGIEPTNDIIAAFIQKYLSKYYLKFKNKNLSKKFYEVFRNGLSHQWSPKASGVAMDFSDNWLINKFKTNGEDILVLNVPTFFYITRQGLTDFEEELDQDKTKQKLFEVRYSTIVNSDYKEMRILRYMLEKDEITE